jgi:hypothetical protein
VVTADQNVQLDITPMPPLPRRRSGAQELLQQLPELKRVTDPNRTPFCPSRKRVRRVEVFVDANGTNEGVPGSKRAVTIDARRLPPPDHQRKIEEALAGAEEYNVKIGVDAAISTQFAKRTEGADPMIDNHVRPAPPTVLHRGHCAEHRLFRRHRRAQRSCPTPRSPDALERLHRAARAPER